MRADPVMERSWELWTTLAVLACVGCAAPFCDLDELAEDCAVFDAFTLLADPTLPARRLPGRVRLASSRAPEPPAGVDNGDFDHFVRIQGNEAVLLEAQGPGVLTRLWFTFRIAGRDMSVGDDARLHLYVDGTEVVFVPGERGVTLGVLTSGTLPAFPRPWVAGRELSSDGLQVFVPIQFQQSIGVTLDHIAERTTYYQIDWRELPHRTALRSFDGTLRAAEEEALARATRIWVDRELAVAESLEREAELGPGESLTLDLAEPAILRHVSWNVADGDRSALAAALSIDGVEIIDGPAHRWPFAPAPASPFRSALAVLELAGLSMDHPAPVEEAASLVLRNTSGEPLVVHARLGYDPGLPPEGLGALRVACGAPRVEVTGGNVALLDVRGARGHYAGQSLVVRSEEWGWSMMEGDHEVRVDGRYELFGTGIEDYFGGSFYYLAGPFALPFTGATGVDQLGAEPLRGAAKHVSQYRHHLLDAPSFEESFAFEWEVSAPGTTYDHCSFWYLDR